MAATAVVLAAMSGIGAATLAPASAACEVDITSGECIVETPVAPVPPPTPTSTPTPTVAPTPYVDPDPGDGWRPCEYVLGCDETGYPYAP